MMVNIQLDSKWGLTSDSRQWILAFDGRAQTFHSKLDIALNSYLERKLKESDAKTINTLLLRQKQLTAALNSVVTPLEIKVVTKKQGVGNDKD